MKSDKGIRWGQCKNPLFARLLEDFIKRLQPLMSGYEIVWFKSEFVEVRMIVPVDETNLLQAATIHSISWKESHRAFCAPDFIETHTPDRQREYLRNKMNNGTKLYMLVEEKPIGVVSVTKGLIEDLYILPDMQNMGHGTKLLLYAVGQCTDTPTLWILENNINAERLYRRIGFKETGRKNATNKLDEIEFALTLISVCRT